MSAGFSVLSDFVAHAQLLHRALAVVLGEHVGAAAMRFSASCAAGSFRLSAMPRLLRFIAMNAADSPASEARCMVRVSSPPGTRSTLMHVGAQVGEQHAAGRAGHDLRQLEHLQARERSGHG